MAALLSNIPSAETEINGPGGGTSRHCYTAQLPLLRTCFYSSRCRRQSARKLCRFRRLLGLGDRSACHSGGSHNKNTPAFLAFRFCVQSSRNTRPRSRLLPRGPDRCSCIVGAVWRDLRDSDHLRAPVNDHARHGILLVAASTEKRSSSLCWRRGDILGWNQSPIGRQTGNSPTTDCPSCFTPR